MVKKGNKIVKGGAKASAAADAENEVKATAAKDWLGDASGDEAFNSDEEALKLGSDASGSDEGSEEEEGGEDGLDGEGSDGEEPAAHTEGSQALARISGENPDNLAAVKQRIADDAALLSNWRKSRQLGHTRTRDEVFKSLVVNCSTYYGYSEELAEYFLQMFSPEKALEFFEANEKHRPVTIRTNSLKARRSSLIQSLTNRKVQVDPVGPWTKVGLKVYQSQVPIGATPEYLGGQYMIQSASSLVPVMALAPQQNEIILDMAAAPGGKTTYIGQLMRNTGTLFANDLRKERCKSLVANVHRMGLTNTIVMNMDGRKLENMLPKLDRVLLDAPCTGSGIIARDPSVKVKRGQQDFIAHNRLQKELLITAIDMVDANSKTGGFIVYSTCSVSVEENEAVIDHALKVRNVEVVSFTSSVNFGVDGLAKYREKRFHPSISLCRRYYPHVHNMDGFFVAKLRKISNDIPERVKKDRSKGDDHVKVWGEEHWTPEMMETVMDFESDEEAGAANMPASKKKKLNKHDRKKVKREEQLRERARAMKASESKAAPGGSEKTPKEPEETAKAGKKRRRDEAKAAAEKPAASPKAAPKEEPAAAAASPKKKLLKKKAAAQAEPPAPKAAEAEAPSKKKRKKA